MAGEKVGRGHRALARRLKPDQMERTAAACHLDASPCPAQHRSRRARAIAEARSQDFEGLAAKVDERSGPGLECADFSLELGGAFSEIQQAVLLLEHRGEHHPLAWLRRWMKLAAQVGRQVRSNELRPKPRHAWPNRSAGPVQTNSRLSPA